MAKLVDKITLGIDVSKDELVVFNWHTQQRTNLTNQRQVIRDWLQSWHEPLQLAIEPTSTFHLVMVDEALALGHTVYLVNTRALVHYREAVEVRNKTDLDDARLLARYLDREGDSLRPFQPHSRKAQRLWALILRRATVVNCRQRLQQSFAQVSISIQSVLRQLNGLKARLEKHILRLIRELGWEADYHYCRSVPGIGVDNATALTAVYHRGAFAGADAFVAYLGLDVRVRESGTYKGQSKLSKRGEPELRRLLYCAARGATSHWRFADYRQRQLDKGLPKIAANIILGRKLARIAFTLMERQEMFDDPRPVTGSSP